MNMCDDCAYNIGGYCILFDDVLSYEDCIFKEDNQDD